jgi:hypothetical protein
MNFQSILSVWSLRFGVTLAILPLPAFATTILYSASVTRHAKLIPEDIWPVLTATVLFLIFAGVCLIPSILLLWPHLRRSQFARWVFGLAVFEIVLLSSFIVYVNVI